MKILSVESISTQLPGVKGKFISGDSALEAPGFCVLKCFAHLYVHTTLKEEYKCALKHFRIQSYLGSNFQELSDSIFPEPFLSS